MAIIKWDPFKEMIDLQDEMNRLFRDFFALREEEREFGRLWRPPLDIVETRDNFVIHIELPGFEKNEIDISIFDNALTVKGERKVAPLGEGETYLRQERPFGPFERTLDLNTEVKADEVKATFNNGVLEIIIPKAEAVKPKKIEIAVE